MVVLVFLALKVLLEPPEPTAFLALTVLRDLQVHQDFQANQGLTDLKERWALLEFQEQLALLVHLELLENPGRRVLGHQDQLDQLVNQDQLDHQDHLARQD